jgi:hypothetical protein
MKTEETISIKVSRFRDKNGEPTCAADFAAGLVCRFYVTIGLGQSEKCTACLDDRKSFIQLHRRGANRDGSLIPGEKCPLWQGEQ